MFTFHDITILTNNTPLIICGRRHFQTLPFFKNIKYGMIFHENGLLTGNSHEKSFIIFRKLRKRSLICCLLQCVSEELIKKKSENDNNKTKKYPACKELTYLLERALFDSAAVLMTELI